jgi:hypothetical protein
VYVVPQDGSADRRSASDVSREGDLPDRDIHKLCVIAPGRVAGGNGFGGGARGATSRPWGGEYSSLINDGLRVYQERESGRAPGKASRKPEFYSTSPATSKVPPVPRPTLLFV